MQVTWNGDENALAVLGGIEDAKYGYSENVPFSTVPASGPADLSTVQTTYASPGIMVGAQDPMMGFPANLTFQPYGYFRNISGQPMKLSGQIFYSKGGQSASLRLPDTILAAHSSLSLPLQSMIQGLGLNGAITVVFSYSGQAGALLASTGSVDTTGNYVFAVPAHPSGQSAGKTSTFWTTANGFDTMYSIWNPASQAQPLLATFQLGNGQTYLYPVTVPASGTAMIDVKEIGEMGAPDINGNKLPVSVTQGRVSFSAASGKPADPINVVVGGGIYNPAKAVCGYTCETCDGCTTFMLVPNPGDGTLGVLMQFYAQCPWTTGTLEDYTYSSSWSSDPIIITFDSPGLGDPTAAGSTTVSAQLEPVPASMGQICGTPPLPNCQYVSPVVVAPVNVNSLVCSPSPVTRGSQVTCTLQGPGTASNWQFTSSTISGATVSSSGGSSGTTWAGTAVDSGTVTASASSTTVTASITVAPRNWALSPSAAAQVPNGDPSIGLTLPQPPQPQGGDSGLGFFYEVTGDGGLNYSPIDSGPNQGYSYVANISFSPCYFHYEINPDLTNSQTTFSLHQYGACGYISWSNLNTQTNRHEAGQAGSHYSEYVAAINGGNPGTYIESQIASPSMNAASFFGSVRTQLTSMYSAIGTAAGQENIPPVNYDANYNFLGNINYLVNGQYATCNQ